MKTLTKTVKLSLGLCKVSFFIIKLKRSRLLIRYCRKVQNVNDAELHTPVLYAIVTNNFYTAIEKGQNNLQFILPVIFF